MKDEEEDIKCQHGESDEGDWKDLLFTPTEAPIYGGQSIFISCGGQLSPLSKDIEYYLLFEGKNLRHLTSTKFVNPFTLQAIVPDHDMAEIVDLSVACTTKDKCTVRTKTRFTFTLDMTVLLAQSLAMNSLNSAALKQLELMYNSLLVVTADERKGLDQRLANAFKQLQLPDTWGLANNQASWTLLHLCAKYDLLKLAELLCARPGAVEALLVRDENGQNPVDIAKVNESFELMELFSRSPLEEDHIDYEMGDAQKPVIKRHKLGTTTITNVIGNGERTIEQDVKLLEDLHNLAVESKKNAALKQSTKPEGTFSHPLANSLQKLREINLEIQRLRCLTQADDLQIDKELEERRARSYSCPDSFDASRSDKMVFGRRRHSASLRSPTEEDEDKQLDDINALKGDLEEENEDETGTELETVQVKAIEEMGAQQTGDEAEKCTENSLCDKTGIPIRIEVTDVETDSNAVYNVVASEDLENDVGVTVCKENGNGAAKNLRFEDGDDSGVSGTLDDSTIEYGKRVTEGNDGDDIVEGSDAVDGTEGCDSPIEVKHDHVAEHLENEAGNITDAPVLMSKNELESEMNENAESLSAQDGPESSSSKTSLGESDQNYDQQDFHCRSGNNMVSEMRTLAAVTEETEEELLQLDVKDSLDPFSHKSHSLEEIKALRWSEERLHHSAEQVYLPKVVMRKGILKKDRPLSDNYENIKMIARESQLNRLGKQSDSDDSVTALDKRKSKSLDMLLVDDENGKSPSLTSSQLSLSDIHGSVESLQSIDRLEAQGIPLYRTKSTGSGSLGHRASLTDISFSMKDEADESAPIARKRRSRFSFKRKSKSTTALDKKGVGSQDNDRRKTIMGGISTEKLFSSRKTEDFGKNKQQTAENSRISNRDSGIDSTCELRLDDIMLTTSNSKDGMYPPSTTETGGHYLQPSKDRNRTMSEVSGDRDTEDDDLDMDTDEGTSSEIAERVRKSSICTEEKKKEKKFGFLSKSRKDKKLGKEKDAAEKALKKSHKDGKTSFLGKKPSFRQGARSSSVSGSSSDSKMFARGSSLGKPGANQMHSASTDSLRSSGRGKPSPTGSRLTLDAVDGVIDSDHSSTNLNSALSSSLGSLNLEEVADAPFEIDDLSQYDSDLDIKNEPETWSDLVEKKVQRKLHAKDIKRQDVIYELIFTESNYVRTLKIVSMIYIAGLRRELGMDDQTIEALFPRHGDLLEINGKFCERLKRRQTESNNNVIEEVGDILVDQFDGPNGEFMKQVYGYFCSRHLQAVALYKDLMKTDKKFALFIRKCMLNEKVRRLSIPECITLATQRLTKYPLLFEAILKATKESKSDYENVKKSITKVKEVLMAVDDHVRDYEKHQQLMELKQKIDPRGEIQLKNEKVFKNAKLFNRRSVLINEGSLTWRGKAKSADIRAVLLADKIFFLHEKDQRYSLISLDNQPPVIYLKSLLARENAADPKALYLVNNELPAMYEMVCPSKKSKDQWMHMILDAVKNRPDEEDENQSDIEEEQRKEEESRMSRLKEIMDSLQVADYQFVNLIADKNKLVVELRELMEKMGYTKKSSASAFELTATDVLEGREILEKAISGTSSLTTLMYDNDMHSTNTNLQPSSTTVPKRAETFGGFDRNSKTLAPPIHVSRASSLKQENRLSLGGKPLTMDYNHGSHDPKERVRKTSQGIMSVIGRNKPNESSEDLSSPSSSNLNLVAINTGTAQKILALTQLKDDLTSLMDVTNKQDIELASMRVDLYETRAEVNKLRAERDTIEEKRIQQQKEHERQMNRQKEVIIKYERTVDKLNRQVKEYKNQLEKMEIRYMELQKRSQTGISSKSSKSNSLSALHNRHRVMQEQVVSNSHASGRPSHSREDSDDQDVIFF